MSKRNVEEKSKIKTQTSDGGVGGGGVGVGSGGGGVTVLPTVREIRLIPIPDETPATSRDENHPQL